MRRRGQPASTARSAGARPIRGDHRRATAASRRATAASIAAELSSLGGGRHGLPDLLRQHEAHVLAQDLELGDVRGAAVAEERDEVLDELLRGARARGDADDARALEPLLLHLVGAVDQVRRAPRSRATSTRRFEFEEFVEPITRTRSHCAAIWLTAAWRFVVA